MLHGDVLLAGEKREEQGLQCSIDGSQWVRAVGLTELPGSNADRHPSDQLSKTFKSLVSKHHEEESSDRAPLDAARFNSGDLQSCVRFRCPFNASHAVQSGALMTLRLLALGRAQWRIPAVVVRCAGYPLLSGNRTDCAQPLSGPQDGDAESSSSGAVTVTACMPVFVGAGYEIRTVVEYVAWYTLLGANLVVIFESIEPEVHARQGGPDQGKRARENQAALYQLAHSMKGRLHIVSGLSSWQMMRRTWSHMYGQTLASNICKQAAGDLGKSSSTIGGRASAAYVTVMDVDEFLVPPISRVHVGGVRGALSVLARRLHTTESTVSALYLNDSAASQRRREPVPWRAANGRCLVFANVYYLPSQCDSHSSVDRPSAVLRLDSRVQPDRFESGPSHQWQVTPAWNFLHRSKFLTSAGDDTMVGVHECCCTLTVHQGVLANKCLRAGGWGMPSRVVSELAPCTTVEHMPLEFWEVRHLKYGFHTNGDTGEVSYAATSSNATTPNSTEPSTLASRCAKNFKGLRLVHVSPGNQRGARVKVNGTLNPLPAAWAQVMERNVGAYMRAMRDVGQRLPSD